MSVGTGIFLGLLCLAAVLLYTRTRDSGRWRTILRWIAVILVTLLIAVAIWLGYSYIRGYVESRPRKVDRYAEISLGDSKEQVLYEKGTPSEVLEDSTEVPTDFRLNVEIAKIPPGKHITDYKYWSYESPDVGRLDVDFSPTTQRVVRIFCYSTEQHECPSLLNISRGETEDQVVDALGKPDHTKLDYSTKTLHYAEFHVAFYLERRRVYGFEVGARADAAHVPGPTAACLTPPKECTLAHTAKQCADILGRVGKNPFDAYGTEGCAPVYNPALTPSDTHAK